MWSQALVALVGAFGLALSLGLLGAALVAIVEAQISTPLHLCGKAPSDPFRDLIPGASSGPVYTTTSVLMTHLWSDSLEPKWHVQKGTSTTLAHCQPHIHVFYRQFLSAISFRFHVNGQNLKVFNLVIVIEKHEELSGPTILNCPIHCLHVLLNPLYISYKKILRNFPLNPLSNVL